MGQEEGGDEEASVSQRNADAAASRHVEPTELPAAVEV